MVSLWRRYFSFGVVAVCHMLSDVLFEFHRSDSGGVVGVLHQYPYFFAGFVLPMSGCLCPSSRIFTMEDSKSLDIGKTSRSSLDIIPKSHHIPHPRNIMILDNLLLGDCNDDCSNGKMNLY
ncbi:unnamed protein product [Lathyrus oleraceus]